jgi:3',5'-cyclic AMP phosphodiesterase CpdA
MRTLVHLSDLHFGRVEPRLLAPLARQVHALAPHVVVVSGDLTQRAKSAEFRDARRFLDTLPQPVLAVPGNHDVPLYNVLQRFFQPLGKYRRYISPDTEPVYADDEVAIVGLNTARSAVFKGGRVNAAQLARVASRFVALAPGVVRIVATHHPFDLPAGHGRRALVGRARLAMDAFAACGADILLAGHLHASHVGDSATRYPLGDYSALVVQAGTATSVRGRGEANSFNVLRVAPDRVDLERFAWTGSDFAVAGRSSFARTAGRWRAR